MPVSERVLLQTWRRYLRVLEEEVEHPSHQQADYTVLEISGAKEMLYPDRNTTHAQDLSWNAQEISFT
jgi:hypothetical protein